MKSPADIFMSTHSDLARICSNQANETDPHERAIRDVMRERERQDALVIAGKLPFNCASPDIPGGGKMMVLSEEFGEVARAAYECYCADLGPDDKQVQHLRMELIQLAAVAVAWAESLDEI